MTDAKKPLDGFHERFLERRGVRLRYFVAGEGPPLLLVHGYGGSAWNFGELAPLLARGRRLLIPDLPGHGGSSPLPAAPNLAAYADPLVTLCHKEGAAHVDVVGHSLGGAVTVRLAARRPELVRRVVLAAAAGISSGTRAAEFFLSFFGLVQPGRLAGRRPEAIARSPRLRRLVFPHFSVSDPFSLTDRAVVGLLRGPALHTDVLSAANALVREDPRADLHRVACPVLCVWGAQDAQVPVDDAFQYARRLRAPLRVIADCGHLLIAERPDACADAIETFLG
ncbi:MAG TPA: alpha/beta fold hydrolase [Gaiellaceae bacterium]